MTGGDRVAEAVSSAAIAAALFVGSYRIWRTRPTSNSDVPPDASKRGARAYRVTASVLFVIAFLMAAGTVLSVVRGI